jgi:hypothetical protein
MEKAIKILEDKTTKDEFKAIKSILDNATKQKESKLDYSNYIPHLREEDQDYIKELEASAFKSLKIWSDKLSIGVSTLINFVYDYDYELEVLKKFNQK